MRALVFLFLVVGVHGADIGSPIPFPPVERMAKPACECGSTCRCENGRIDPRCTCENCKCAIVSGRRGNVEETSSHRPCESQAATPKPKAKENCETCGLACTCRDCKCTATTWRDGCGAIPAGHKEAYIRSITARSVPQTNFQQGPAYPTTQITPAIGAAGASSLSRQYYPAAGIRIGAPAGMYGNTSGCASGG
jgi:hypothetical protein